MLVTLLALGIFFRFVNLDQKAYWLDETFTSLHISGYTDIEVIHQVADGHVVTKEELQKYQYPNSEKSVVDTIKRIATTAPELPPLYFVVARFWVQCFGNSVTVIRSLSALISLLSFPCIYWLCIELFGLPLVGWLAIALISVSPFHVLYAQEARPYSLFTVAILLSSTLLLRAMRLQTKLSWSTYAVAITLGLYTHLLFTLVVISHAVYVLAIDGFRLTKVFFPYVIASLVGLVFFAPWIYITVLNFSDFQSTEQTIWNLKITFLFSLIKGWVRGISMFFLDFNLNETSPHIYLIPFLFVLLVVLILVGYSMYFTFSSVEKRTGLFIFVLIVIPALALILPDLFFGGIRSTAVRYLVPCYLSIQLTVAYLFAAQITYISVQSPWRHKLWKIAMFALISLGLLSCIDISQSKLWWNKAESNLNYYVARTINQAIQPLLVSDTFFVRVLSLNHSLDEKVKLQLVVEQKIPKVSDSFREIFLYKPSQTLQVELEKGYSIEHTYTPSLWRLTKQ